MPHSYSCNACNAEFEDETVQKAHYRSEWHRYNLRRKVVGVPGVTEALYNMRVEALAREQRNVENAKRMLYKCVLCSKEYTTEKAHAQHLQSKLHLGKVAAQPDGAGGVSVIIRPAPPRPDLVETAVRPESKEEDMESDTDRSDEEWEEVDGEEGDEIADLEESDVRMDGLEGEEGSAANGWDVTQCFFCDLKPDGTVESCVEHMHKAHGFFIPDSEYLKDVEGLLTYLALKVTRGFVCLYCDYRGKRFQSREAVRKHMISKSHCKLWYADGDEEGAEEELEEFYDFSSSYMVEGQDYQLVAVRDSDMEAPVSLTSGGLELVLKSTEGKPSRTIGSRELFRYYKQRPRPSETRNEVLVNAVVAKYRSLGVATLQPGFSKLRQTEEMRKRPSRRAEVIRSRIALRNNLIRNLPKNCTH